MRRLELTRSATLDSADRPNKFAVFGKLLHQSAHVCDQNRFWRSHQNPDWPFEARWDGGKLPAETAEPILIISPGQKKVAVRVKFLHAIIRPFGRIDVAGAVERQEVW